MTGCKERVGTMSYSWTRNAASWIQNLGTGLGLSLLGRAVLRFLGLPLRILHLCRSSLLPTNTRPSPEPSPRPPTVSMCSSKYQLHLYSSSTSLVYGSQSCPSPGFALLPPSPPIHKEREMRQLRPVCAQRGESNWSIWSDSQGPTRNERSATPMSDVSDVDERHRHHRVFKPRPSLPSQLRFLW